MYSNQELFELLQQLRITYELHEHPPAASIEDAKKYWKDLNAARCKNLFFRNHKGDKHYLVILEHEQQLDIHDLEKRLRQGKLSFASDERLMKHLGVKPGSVTPFGLINDKARHVHLFIDKNLQNSSHISFHPNINTQTLVLPFPHFLRFLDNTGNHYEFVQLYD
jgi:Ala-tRNA(Pro) deacylase